MAGLEAFEIRLSPQERNPSTAEISLAARRAVVDRALVDPAYRALLRSDPKAAVAQETGIPLPDTMQVGVLEETAGTWALCMPRTAVLADMLPAPGENPRYILENALFQALRRDGTLWNRMLDEPQALVAAMSPYIPPGICFLKRAEDEVLLRRETENETWLVLHDPKRDFTTDIATRLAAPEDGELSDELLELVSAGGGSSCQGA